MPTREEVLQAIEQAFASVVLGDGISIREANAIDDYASDEEQAAARKEDDPSDWRKVSDKDIERYWAALVYTDAEGYRYYIPAFMRYSVIHFEDCQTNAVDDTLSSLYPGPRSERQMTEARYALLNDAQESAIRLFLEYMHDLTYHKVLDTSDAANALRYWKERASRKPATPPVLARQMRRKRL